MSVELQEIAISLELQQLINADLAWTYSVIPAEDDGQSITFYISSESDQDFVKEDLEILMGKSIRFIEVDNLVLRRHLGKYYRRFGNAEKSKVNTHQGDKDDFLLQVIHEARGIGSSDIHIEIYEEEARVRIRIDGHLVEKYKPVSYTHLRAHETVLDLVCRLLLEKKKT